MNNHSRKFPGRLFFVKTTKKHDDMIFSYDEAINWQFIIRGNMIKLQFVLLPSDVY